ncbi:MAG: hypothetical protein ACPG32_06240 [Akkermansiaceae bacterium]
MPSCGEDEALVKQNEELRVQVSDLESRVAIAEARAGKDPGDQTKALKKTNEELAATLKQLEELDAELEALAKAHREKEKAFRDYQRKYPISE